MKTDKYDFRIRAAVLRWHDGDTFWGALDQGCGMFRGGGIKVTLQGTIELEGIRNRAALIQAPEMLKEVAGPNGKMIKVSNQPGVDAWVFASQLVPPGIYPCITYKADDNFDRPLIDLILPQGLFSEIMLDAGHAIVYKN